MLVKHLTVREWPDFFVFSDLLYHIYVCVYVFIMMQKYIFWWVLWSDKWSVYQTNVFDTWKTILHQSLNFQVWRIIGYTSAINNSLLVSFPVVSVIINFHEITGSLGSLQLYFYMIICTNTACGQFNQPS